MPSHCLAPTIAAAKAIRALSVEARAALDRALRSHDLSIDKVADANFRLEDRRLRDRPLRAVHDARTQLRPEAGDASFADLAVTIGRRAAVPTYYRVITQRNLFRPLGWGRAKPRNPFRVLGIVAKGRTRRALIAREGAPMGLYVGAGDEVGEGYHVTSIVDRTVTLAGRALGEVQLTLGADRVPAD